MINRPHSASKTLLPCDEIVSTCAKANKGAVGRFDKWWKSETNQMSPHPCLMQHECFETSEAMQDTYRTDTKQGKAPA
ncbi:hypothetical protein XELAEV_18025051mg [Xenopus laevis]|uniref:Uncharacterized protein n=1 Tax=Xenopus laevis TaxID=8355 RepID=A0A974HLI1_XENLA|nr:hypothetical protein XELAEV_18025051mg [Xenopus laevis]